MKSIKLGLSGLILSTMPSFAAPEVTVSIKPVHSIVSALMDGVAEPNLIVTGAASPHGFALKPSHAQKLQSSDIVVWVGHSLEGFLEKPMETIAKDAVNLELMDLEGLKIIPFREGGHEGHGHGEHEEEKHDDHDDHAHEKEKHDHDDHDDHDKKHADHDLSLIHI